MNKRFLVATVTLSLSLSVCFGISWGQENPLNLAGGKSEHPRIRELIDKNLPKLRSNHRGDREDAIHELQRDLMTIGNSEHRYPEGATKKRLSKELVNLYSHTQDGDFSHPSIRRELISEITRYGDNEIAKPFVFKILDTGSTADRDEALRVLGDPGGISGNDVYDKINELAKRGLIDKEARTTYLARVDKDRALVEILRDIKSKDKQVFLYSAWVLQDYYRRPGDFKLILPRLKELGLDKDKSFKGGNGLHWIDANLFASYVDSANGDDLRLALEFMVTHDEFVRPVSTPVLIRKLNHIDSKIRTLAAQALGREAEWSIEESEKAKAPIQQVLSNESDPGTKRAMQAVVKQIERFENNWRRSMEQARQGNHQ